MRFFLASPSWFSSPWAVTIIVAETTMATRRRRPVIRSRKLTISLAIFARGSSYQGSALTGESPVGSTTTGVVFVGRSPARGRWMIILTIL